MKYLKALLHTKGGDDVHSQTPSRRWRRPRSPARRRCHLTEKEDGSFVPMATKAIQRKALRESLVACSAALKKQIKGRGILKRKNALGALDLGRLAWAAGLSCSDHQAVAVAAAPTIAPRGRLPPEDNGAFPGAITTQSASPTVSVYVWR